MIELPWREKLPIDKYMLRIHVDRMIRRSEMNDIFTILMPMPVYEYIKKIGINAELVELPDITSTDMIWLMVSKAKSGNLRKGKHNV